MKYLSIFLVVFALGARVAADDSFRLRPVDAWAGESFERAWGRSPLVRELVQQIESSNLVVHIETRAVMPMGLAGATWFVASAGGHRYVRISLLRELEPDERAAILGHELQHACELAASTAASHDAVRELFETTGHRVGGKGKTATFDTDAAVLAGQRAWAELRSTSRQEVPSRREVPSRQEVPSRKDR
jgi:hypothetical protein